MSDKRTQIIEASIDLFATNGFWNTPTSKITKHAGVSTGTLFNYFASKDVLIDEVYLLLRQEGTAHMVDGYPEQGTVKERAEHSWFRYIDWAVRNPVRYKLLHQMKLSDLVSSEAQNQSNAEMAFAAETIKEGVDSGLFGDVSADLYGHLIVAQLGASANYAIAHSLTDMPLTKHIARTFEIFWVGVTS